MGSRFDYVPGMNAFTVTIPAELQDWVDARLAEGVYVDAADYVRALLRQDRAVATDREWLKAMIAEGLASGVDERDARVVLAEIIAEDPDLRD